jgi:hypothetical protein
MAPPPPGANVRTVRFEEEVYVMRDQQHFRKIMAGGAMVLSPILAAIAWLMWPTLTKDATTFIAETVDIGRTRVVWANVLTGVSIALAVVAIMGLVHLLHDRRGALGSAGGGLAIMGLVLVAASCGLGLAMGEIAFSDLVSFQKETLFDALITGPGYVLVAVGSIAMTLGLIGLATALATARVVPQPSAYLLAVFGIVQIVGFALYSGPVVIASFVVLAAALIPVGLEVLMETDEAWEHPVRFRGFGMAHQT